MTIRELINANPQADDATIAGLYNADPTAWKPVASNAVREWYSTGGRLSKLEAFVAASAALALAVEDVRNARDGVRGVLSSNDPTTYLTLSPTVDGQPNPQRLLVESLPALCEAVNVQPESLRITPADADALIVKARTRDDVTAEDVAAEREAIAADEARSVLATRAASLSSWIAEQMNPPTGEQVAARWEASNP